jgi:hypothetical protein
MAQTWRRSKWVGRGFRNAGGSSPEKETWFDS